MGTEWRGGEERQIIAERGKICGYVGLAPILVRNFRIINFSRSRLGENAMGDMDDGGGFAAGVGPTESVPPEGWALPVRLLRRRRPYLL